MPGNSILRSSFLKHVVTLITGTALAQVIPVLLQPLLRRMFSPEEFGLFAVYLSLVGMLPVLTTLRYEQAVVLPEKDEDAMQVVGLSWLINLFFAAFLSVGFFLLEDVLIQWLDMPEGMHFWLHWVPVGIFLLSAYRVMSFWLVRKKHFKSASSGKVVRRATEGAMQSGLGFAGWPAGLMIGDLVGNFFQNVVTWFLIVKAGFQWSQLSGTGMKAMAKRYSNFPKEAALPALLNQASLMLPVIIINKIFAEATTGQFDLTRQVLYLPLSLISMALSQVLLQRIAERRQQGAKIGRDIYGLSLGLGALAGIGVLMLALWGQPLFTWAFGTEWDEAGLFARILAVSFAIKFVVSPLSTVLIALERLKTAALWQIVYFVLILILPFFDFLDIYSFLWLYAGIDVVAYCFYFALIAYTVHRHDQTAG